MGVMLCKRGDCPEVLCYLYSDQYGYICHYCYDDLVASGPETNIAKFMESNIPNRGGGRDAEATARYAAVFQDTGGG